MRSVYSVKQTYHLLGILPFLAKQAHHLLDDGIPELYKRWYQLSPESEGMNIIPTSFSRPLQRTAASPAVKPTSAAVPLL